MNINHLHDLTRRSFLKRGALLSLSGALSPWSLQLSLLADAAAAETASDDYKALVCIFLNGGNDYANTIIPVDNTHYQQYTAVRTTLSIAQENLLNTQLSTSIPLADGLQFALAPELAPLKSIWENGHLAVQLNVGPLIVPTTITQYKTKAVPLPPKLFSHNDQTSIWQSGMPEGAVSGWGGRIGDLLESNNSKSTFTSISANRNAVFLSGQNISQYQISTSGAVPIKGIVNPLFGSTACQAALKTLTTQSYPHLFANEYAQITRNSINSQAQINSSINAVQIATVFDTTNSLATQLQIVAKIIAAHSSLGTKRQVFMVSLDGFDNHDNLLQNHPILLGKLASAMKSFYDATVELGLEQNITTFTSSEFGRTLTVNTNGSDHGWGNHHFVMGGAVLGKKFYGKAPQLANGGNDDVGQGRLLPTTSVDQYAATFARWMGVSDSNLETILPNIGNFANRGMGFV
jgi:uncharacterized protein (DUF1501 family)